MGNKQKSKEKRKERPAKPLLETVAEDGSSSFARALGSVDFHTRERGLQALSIFLQRSGKLTPLAMRKLWKGLFYCFWHSDKAPVQEQLASRLAAILPSLSNEVALLYLSGFLEAMQREWFGIDRLRLDKFLMLVRRFISQVLVVMLESQWDLETVSTYMDSLLQMMKDSDVTSAAGLSFQVADAFLPELLTVLSERNEQVPDQALRKMLSVFAEVIATSTRPSLPPRFRTSVFDALLEEIRNPSEKQPLGKVDVAALSTDIFNRGAEVGVKATPRQLLYDVSLQLDKSSRKRQKLGTDTQAPEHYLNGHLEQNGSPANPPNPVDNRVTGTNSDPAASQTPAKRKSEDRLSLPDFGALSIKTPQSNKRAKSNEKQANGTMTGDLSADRGQDKTPTSSKKKKKRKSKPEEAEPELGSEQEAAGNVAGAVAQVDAAPNSSGKRKKQKRGESQRAEADEDLKASLDTEAVARATERTKAVIGAQKRGETTVNPATPGSPRDTDFDSVFNASLEVEARRSASASPSPRAAHEATVFEKQQKDTPRQGRTRLSNAGTPQTAAKHVKFQLRKNLYFQKGGVVPSPEVRTPVSCRPKGSALKAVSKFPKIPVQGSKTSPSKGTPKKKKQPAAGSQSVPNSARKKAKSRLGLKQPSSASKASRSL